MSNSYDDNYSGAWPNARTGPVENYVWETLASSPVALKDSFRTGWSSVNFLQRTSVIYSQDVFKTESPLDFPWKYSTLELKEIPNTQTRMITYSKAKFVSSPSLGRLGPEEPFVVKVAPAAEADDEVDDEFSTGAAQTWKKRVGFSPEIFFNLLFMCTEEWYHMGLAL